MEMIKAAALLHFALGLPQLLKEAFQLDDLSSLFNSKQSKSWLSCLFSIP
jgi:hypothetical protein